VFDQVSWLGGSTPAPPARLGEARLAPTAMWRDGLPTVAYRSSTHDQ